MTNLKADMVQRTHRLGAQILALLLYLLYDSEKITLVLRASVFSSTI